MISVKVKNIDKVIRQLEKYRDNLKSKQHRLLEKLAEIGIDVATARFGSAQYDGVNDVVVQDSPEWVDETKLIIYAFGTTVTFIEFGTGVHYTEQHPKAEELGAIRGEFGQGKGSQTSWGFYGEPGTNGKVIKTTDKGNLVITQGNPPARAMYDAGKEMRTQILQIAREVFKND